MWYDKTGKVASIKTGDLIKITVDSHNDSNTVGVEVLRSEDSDYEPLFTGPDCNPNETTVPIELFLNIESATRGLAALLCSSVGLSVADLREHEFGNSVRVYSVIEPTQ